MRYTAPRYEIPRVVEDADPYGVTAKSAQNPCLPREGGVGVADGGSVKGQTPPVSHPLDSPLGEGAKKDCAYAQQNLHNLTATEPCLAPWERWHAKRDGEGC